MTVHNPFIHIARAGWTSKSAKNLDAPGQNQNAVVTREVCPQDGNHSFGTCKYCEYICRKETWRKDGISYQHDTRSNTDVLQKTTLAPLWREAVVIP